MTETVVPTAEIGARLPETPFVGLVPYSESDAQFFFGREGEKSIVKANLRASRLTVLYGPSGVGKSSLLLAGVVHDLRAQARRTAEEKPARAPAAVCVFRSWRDDSLPALMEAIHAAGTEALGDDQLTRWHLGDSPVETLHTWTERVRTFLVVLDQFEDYFLYRHDEAGEGTFAEALPLIVNDETLRVNVLLSIREDAWAKLDRFEGQVPGLFENYIRVEHLTRKAAGEAIEGPIGEWNRHLPASEQPYEIKGDLVKAVVDAAALGRLALAEMTDTTPREVPTSVDAVEAPFLQLVMDRLWRATVEAGERALTTQRLAALGGAQRIVETHLLSALGALTAEEQAIAAAAFRFLVTRSKTKIAHSAASLAEWLDRPEDEVVPVLEKLCRGESGRILRAIAPPAGETEGMLYELYHDVLAEPILEWRKQYEQERAREELEARHREEERARREEEEQRLRERRNRLIRIAALVLVAVAIALAVLGGVAVWNWQQAKKYAREARSQQLASLAQTKFAIDPVGASQLAALAVRKARTPQARGALEHALALTRVQAILSGHQGPVLAATFSPNGKLVATASRDRTARIWDAATGQSLAVLRGHTRPVRSVAFSSDGRRLVTASGDNTARVWGVATGQQLAVLRPSKPLHLDEDIYVPFVNATFSSDGSRVLMACPDGAARVWDVSSRKELLFVRSKYDAVNQASFSPDGRRIAVATDGGDAQVWNIDPKGRVAEKRGHLDSVVYTAFSPNGKRLVTTGSDGTVRLGLTTSKRNSQMKGLRSAVREARSDRIGDANAAFSPNGKLIYAVGRDGSAKILNLETGRVVELLPSKQAARVPERGRPPAASAQPRARATRTKSVFATGASFSRDSTLLVTAQDDGTARVWDTRTGVSLAIFRGPASTSLADTRKKRAYTAEFSPDERHVVTTSATGVAVVWGLPRTLRVGSARRSRRFRKAAVSADGHVAVLFGDHAARLEVRGPRPRSIALRGEPQPFFGAAFSADGRLAATTHRDGIARIWNVRTGRLTRAFRDPEGAIVDAALSGDGRLLLTETDFGEATLWTTTGKRIGTLGGRGAPLGFNAGFSPDNRLLVTTGDEGARVWDVRSLKSVMRVKGASSATFSASGELIALTASGQTKIWHTLGSGARPVMIPRRGPFKRYDLSLSPGGRFVLGNGPKPHGSELRVWDSATGRSVADIAASSRVVFSDDGSLLAYIARRGKLRILDLETGAVRSVDHVPPGSSAPLAVNGQHGLVLVGRDSGFARIFDLAAGRWALRLRGPLGPIAAATVVPHGRFVATLSEGIVRVRSVESDRSIVLPGRDIEGLAFSADGHHLATGGPGGQVRVWETATGKAIPGLAVAGGQFDTGTVSLRFAPDGRQILVGTGDTTLISRPARRAKALNVPFAVASAFAPDGELVAVATTDGSARIFATRGKKRTGKLVTILRGSVRPLDDVAFSPDADRIVTASSDGNTIIWTRTGTIIWVLAGHSGKVSHAEFSRDGRIVLTRSGNGAARLWDATTGQPCALFGSAHQRILSAHLLGNRGLVLVHSDGSIERVRVPELCSLTGDEFKTLARRLVQGMTAAEKAFLLQGT